MCFRPASSGRSKVSCHSSTCCRSSLTKLTSPCALDPLPRVLPYVDPLDQELNGARRLARQQLEPTGGDAATQAAER
jgi:hypothetical protein